MTARCRKVTFSVAAVFNCKHQITIKALIAFKIYQGDGFCSFFFFFGGREEMSGIPPHHPLKSSPVYIPLLISHSCPPRINRHALWLKQSCAHRAYAISPTSFTQTHFTKSGNSHKADQMQNQQQYSRKTEHNINSFFFFIQALIVTPRKQHCN